MNILIAAGNISVMNKSLMNPEAYYLLAEEVDIQLVDMLEWRQIRDRLRVCALPAVQRALDTYAPYIQKWDAAYLKEDEENVGFIETPVDARWARGTDTRPL